MSAFLGRLDQLEARFERLLLAFQDVQRQLKQALQQIANNQMGPGGYPGGGLGTIFYIAPVVIAAGNSVTNQTVYALIGGTTYTVTTTATVYNVMAQATVATSGKNIICGPNGDGSYLAITQSC